MDPLTEDELRHAFRRLHAFVCSGIGQAIEHVENGGPVHLNWTRLLDSLAEGPGMLLAGFTDGYLNFTSGHDSVPLVAVGAYKAFLDADPDGPLPKGADSSTSSEDWLTFAVVPEETWGFTYDDFTDGLKRLGGSLPRSENNGDGGYL